METTSVLSRRAALGDADAQFRLGYRFKFCRALERRDPAKAFALWKTAASQGHVRARFYLGTWYDFGTGTGRNLRQAMRCYKQAAIDGHEVAQYNFAMGLRDGVGVKQDLLCYRDGDGVHRSAVKARFWFSRAARRGHERAKELLGATRGPTKALQTDDRVARSARSVDRH